MESGRTVELTAGQIAELVGGNVVGDPSTSITGVNGIREAVPGDLTFVRSGRYAQWLPQSQASVALVEHEVAGCAMDQIVVAQPDVAFAQVLQRFHEDRTVHPAGIHATAVVGADVTLGNGVALDAHVVVADGAVLGDSVVVYAGAYIGREARIGTGSVLYPQVVVHEHCEVGRRCVLHAHCTIGADGFGFTPLGGAWAKIPQVGRVVLGDDVEVGSNSAIDRATFGETRIGRGTKIDNLVQIGHNVQVGEHCVIAGKAGIAGSAHIGRDVRIGAAAGINGHIDVGDGASIGARAGVTASVPPGATVSGFPAIDHNKQRRVLVAQQQAPELGRRIRHLERRLERLEEDRHE